MHPSSSSSLPNQSNNNTSNQSSNSNNNRSKNAASIINNHNLRNSSFNNNNNSSNSNFINTNSNNVTLNSSGGSSSMTSKNDSMTSLDGLILGPHHHHHHLHHNHHPINSSNSHSAAANNNHIKTQMNNNNNSSTMASKKDSDVLNRKRQTAATYIHQPSIVQSHQINNFQNYPNTSESYPNLSTISSSSATKVLGAAAGSSGTTTTTARKGSPLRVPDEHSSLKLNLNQLINSNLNHGHPHHHQSQNSNLPNHHHQQTSNSSANNRNSALKYTPSSTSQFTNPLTTLSYQNNNSNNVVQLKKANSFKQSIRSPVIANNLSDSVLSLSNSNSLLNQANPALQQQQHSTQQFNKQSSNLLSQTPTYSVNTPRKKATTSISTGNLATSLNRLNNPTPVVPIITSTGLLSTAPSSSSSLAKSRTRSKSSQIKPPSTNLLNTSSASNTSLSTSINSQATSNLNNSNLIKAIASIKANSNNKPIKSASLKQTLQNIELKMKIISSPSIRIADLFKCFLKNVPKSTETIESLVHYGDNIGATLVKCLVNENSYETQTLMNQDYDIYQGPALCVTYDAILKDEHWDEIFISNDDDSPNATSKTNGTNGKQSKSNGSSKLPNGNKSSTNGADSTLNSSTQQGSKFMSFFHISDFVAILSGYKVAFVDPYERFAPDERSYVAIFDLEHDTHDIEQFEDQFKPLEKIFNVPLLKNRYYNGTIIRLPLRTQTNACSVSSKLVHVKDIMINAKDFMKEAHLHILFSKNISNIQFCRTKDNQSIEKIYSINVDESSLEHFRQKYKRISDAIIEGDFPRTSTIMITLRKQIETKIEKTDWILCIFADTMRLLNSNYFLMKLAIPISDNCDKDIRFSHKSNLISSDTGFIKTLYLSKPIICYIEDKEGILMSHFCRLNISDSLKLSHFNDAYALMLKDLTKIIRKDPSLLWTLMPEIEKNTEFNELLGEIWTEIAKHELFYSCTEGWGYVAIEDMIINDVEEKSVLSEILTKIYSETNYPVVIMPLHVLKALQKYSPKDSLQIMTPSQTSDILHNNVSLIEQLKPNQKLELLRYLIKEPVSNNPTSSQTMSASAWPASAARYVIDLPLLLLANNKFVRFQSPNKVKTVYIVEKEFTTLFNSDNSLSSQFINNDFPNDLLQILKKFEFQRLTQVQMISDSELGELLNVPKEWRNGDEKIYWPRAHEKYNVEWLETLWKYLTEYCKNDLTMIENFNIIYCNEDKTKSTASTASSAQNKNIILYKLSKNSNLVYTPSFTESSVATIKTDSTTKSTGATNSSNKLNNENNLTEETYGTLINILNKLGFQCIDSLPPTVLSHPSFINYVPNIRTSRYNLLRAFRNKYKHASTLKLIQDFNALLSELDIKLLQTYFSKIEVNHSASTSSPQETSTSNNTTQPTALKLDEENKALLEILKELPIFENSAIECVDRYLPLCEVAFIYDTPIRMPFELTGQKPFILVRDNESKLLVIEKLRMNLVKDFKLIIKEIIKYCASKDLNSLPASKVHAIGKWLLLNCSNYIIDTELNEQIKSAKLFMNQNQELCSASQFINPIYKERFMPIFDTKCLPARDLVAEEKCIGVLKELKMKTCLQLRVDEIIDLYENSIKQDDQYRRLFAELIIELLINRYHDANLSNQDVQVAMDKALNEYSALKAVTLRHFLMSVNWIPLQRDRPQSYPQSLFWKGTESAGSTLTLRFSSPRDCVDSQFAYCAGSVACVSDLDIPNELKSFIDLKHVHLDLVVRHLKLTTKCFESSALKVEWYDYLTIANRCYEFMNTCEPQDIFRELKSNDLNEWIWNGAGFSSLTSIFIITEKDHPLSQHVSILPYELYVFVKFFERLGIKKLPDTKQLELILLKCVKNSFVHAPSKPSTPGADAQSSQLLLESAAKNFPLINWIKQNYSNDKKLTSIIKDYEESLISLSSVSTSQGNKPTLTPFITSSHNNHNSNNLSSSSSSSSSSSPVNGKSPIHESIKLDDSIDNSSDIYLYLPELYKSIEIKDNLINSVMSLVKNKQIKILDEEAYLMRKVAASAAAGSTSSTQNGSLSSSSKNQPNNIYDHHRVYNEIILPNLNSLSKNVKDAVVLFALDHADPKMLEILRDHPCIPVSPFGRRLKKPNKLLHPMGKISALYADTDERFPCGSEETYMREDRLQILKILGMKCDHLSWPELVERAESVSKIREYEAAVERSIALLNVLNEMLNASSTSSTYTGATNGQSAQPNPLPPANLEEKEAKCKACEAIRDIAFIPVKSKPYQKLNLTWYGDKFKYRFAKPKELISAQYEHLCSCTWPVPLGTYKKRENIITKQIEQFLGLDEFALKFTLKDAFKQLEEVCKLNILELDDSKEVKLVTDMCLQIYEYIQDECQRRPSESVHLVREFFAERKVILLNEEFISTNQLCWNLNVNLKPVYHQIPSSYLRSFKYLFSNVLSIRTHLDLSDLLTVVDSLKKKHKENAITNKDEFNLLMNVYNLMIEQGYQIITNLYLPNVNCVLYPGKLLHVPSSPNDMAERADEFVHPAVDRRICTIAGANMSHKSAVPNGLSNASSSMQNLANAPPLSNSVNSLARIFPRVFGNKRLEGILARLDDDRIDLNLLNNIDEGNPQIIIDYLFEANRVHSLSAFLSEDDVFVILKYFNDFLARNYQAGTFQRLKELKMYKALWIEKYINLNFGNTSPPNVYLISEETSNVMKRLFRSNPFASTNSSYNQPCDPILIVKRNELSKLYAHLNLLTLNDLESFVLLCLPQFHKLDAKAQYNLLKFLYDDVLEKSFMHEKEKCFKMLKEKLCIQTQKGEQKLISELYDMKNATLRSILNESHFPDTTFDSPQCWKFLQEVGLRTCLPSDVCKKCMNEIEEKVNMTGWTDELRVKSKFIYEHLIENWQKYDESVVQQRFLEPHCPDKRLVQLIYPFEYAEFNKTCLKLSDAELQRHETLVWSSSFMLPSFVQIDDEKMAEFFKLSRKPCFALVNLHLNNLCESVGNKSFFNMDNDAEKVQMEEVLVDTLSTIYKYVDELTQSEHQKDMCKQLEDKEIIWSSSTRKFVTPARTCVNLDTHDEIAPFLYALSPSLKEFKSLFVRIGAKEKLSAMLYGDILRKMAKVCGDDYLNSNELCKSLKAMECFFKYLKHDESNTISSQFKLPGLYLVSTELKLERSSLIVIVDNRENLDDIAKLPQEKFLFNPGEKVLKMNTNDIKPFIDKIFISQRPTLFSQKYESTYDYTLPEDPDSQRQNLLTSLERKYQQIFTSRQLHRCLARCIANEEARSTSPKHLPIDEVEKVIRERLSSIKVTCVEYLETSLCFRKLTQQQKIEQTVEERACYLTHESLQFATLYVSKKHIEQPYFALCLARSLQPLLADLHFDNSIFTSLIATSVSQMSRLLQLVNVATEENILSVIKLQYVPSSGKLYGDDINLLAAFDPKFHNVLIGDLCVYSNANGNYIYCQIVRILSLNKNNRSTLLEYEFVVQAEDNKQVKISQKDLYVLENWHRIYDAMIAKPPDERESFKYQESNSQDKKHQKQQQQQNQQQQQHQHTSTESEENYSSNGSDSDKSDASSTYSSNDNIPNGIEIEQSKSEVNQELRMLWGLEENERKKKINKLLLKWHPDKNPGKEKFASEVFKHLKKQIEFYKNDPFLANLYKSTYSSSSTYNAYTPSSQSSAYSSNTDDFRSRHYGSYDDLHRKGSPTGGSPHSSPSREGRSHHASGAGSYDYDTKGPSASNLGRTGSFRQEWERRRQQKRQTAGADTRDRSSPSSARRRGTDFTQMDASLWFTQAKCDLDSANNDMHPITGKPSYEWVCYKCYRAVEKGLRAYHYFKGNGKLPASDIHGLLLGVETGIRDIAFRFCNFIGNEATSMQYPSIARFGKTPNEVFSLTKAEQALEYGKELLKLVEEIIYAN